MHKDIKTAASLTNQKIDSILSFLDDVESENTKALTQQQKQSRNKEKQNAEIINEFKKKPLINNFFEREVLNDKENENKLTGRSNSTIYSNNNLKVLFLHQN